MLALLAIASADLILGVLKLNLEVQLRCSLVELLVGEDLLRSGPAMTELQTSSSQENCC